MSIECKSKEQIVVQPFCTPECTRWTQINNGEPVRIYHDTTNYDPNCEPVAPELDPQVHLDAAIAVWETGYPCGQLFEMVDDRSQALVIVQHDFNEFGEPLGTATCLCDAEDDVCVRQADHSQTFTTASPAIMTMYCKQSNQQYANYTQYLNVWIHELGHILGMGHVRNVIDPATGNPVNSIMGVWGVVAQGQLRDFDLEQLQSRYPCDCILTNNFNQFEAIEQVNQTGDFCPGCQGL